MCGEWRGKRKEYHGQSSASLQKHYSLHFAQPLPSPPPSPPCRSLLHQKKAVSFPLFHSGKTSRAAITIILSFRLLFCFQNSAQFNGISCFQWRFFLFSGCRKFYYSKLFNFFSFSLRPSRPSMDYMESIHPVTVLIHELCLLIDGRK